jgi:hypothetical protein
MGDSAAAKPAEVCQKTGVAQHEGEKTFGKYHAHVVSKLEFFQGARSMREPREAVRYLMPQSCP